MNVVKTYFFKIFTTPIKIPTVNPAAASQKFNKETIIVANSKRTANGIPYSFSS
jgi:hypothetical protein